MSSSIWNLPGLDHTAFTAAANYLQVADEQQFVIDHPNHFFAGQAKQSSSGTVTQWNQDGEGEGPWGFDQRGDCDQVSEEQKYISDTVKTASERDITKKFLDRLAQVFAPEKPMDKRKASIVGHENSQGPTSKAHQRLPAAHVTATAMVKRPKEKEIEIFVAKNKGLDDDDTEFANSLFAWLNCPRLPASARQTSKSAKSSPSLEKILDFSISRIRFYIAGILQKRENWLKYKLKVLTAVFKHKSRHSYVLKVFDRIEQLIESCGKYRLAPSAERYEILQLAHRIRSDRDFKQLSFYMAGMETEVEKYFSNLAKDINFLGRLPATWVTLREFAGRYPDYKFIFQPLTPPSFQSINRETLFGTINSYPTNMPEREAALKRLRVKGPLDFTVHCEMQLLLHFDRSPKDKVQFQYFGCSKLSCWMCHEILQHHSAFRTKGTHGRRVGLWAFDTTNQSPKIMFALKRLQDKMTNKLLEEAVRANLTDKSKLLENIQTSQASERIDKEAEALNNAKFMLEKVDKILQKTNLNRCEMSTADITNSMCDNLVEQDVFDRMKERLPPTNMWLAEQVKFVGYGQPTEGIKVARFPKEGGEIEWVKVQLIAKPGEIRNLPSTLLHNLDTFYIPNFSALSADVLLGDWVYFRDPPFWDGDCLTYVNVIFTMKDPEDTNGYIKELKAKCATDDAWDETLLPCGDIFLIRQFGNDTGDQEHFRFLDMPRVENSVIKAQFQQWLEECRFRKGFREFQERQELLVRMYGELPRIL